MLISIITVVLNNEKYIEQTIKSVVNQSYDNIEYIIIDGGSTDGTIEIIKKYENFINYWESEKDSGIYNAMNKGIKISTGQLIGILNSDDWLNPDAVKLVVNNIGKADILIGAATKIYENRTSYWYCDNLSSLRWGMAFPHCSMFVKKDIYIKYGLYNEQLKICSDYLFLAKCVEKSTTITFMEIVLSNFRYIGVSSKADSKQLTYAETREVQKIAGLNFFLERWFYYFLKYYKFRIAFFARTKLGL